MAFVSLAGEPRDEVEAFVNRHAVPWPCGFEVPRRTFASFGVIEESAEPPHDPGVGAIPTLFVIGPDGAVLWNDGCSRYRHRSAGLQQLDQEIEKALAAASPGEP